MSIVEPSDLLTAPGGADFTFGSLLNEMLRRMFTRIESLDPAAPHRFYIECSQCRGTDNSRALGQRSALTRVEHAADCLLAKHMPRLRAMANKDVT